MRPRTVLLLATTMVASLLGAVVPSSAADAGTGSISGRVTAADGTDLAQLEVRLYGTGSGSSSREGPTWVEPDGTFLFDDLEPGRYRLLAKSPRRPDPPYDPDTPWSDAAPQWYPGVDAFVDAEDIVVTAGSATTADVQLPAGGHVSGRVLDAEGAAPTGNNRVEALSQTPNGWEIESLATIADDGTFELAQLNGGPYVLRLNGGDFTIWHRAARFAETYYGDVGSIDEARRVVPVSGTTIDDVVIRPIENGTLGGTVVDARGRPLGGIRVEVSGALINPGLVRVTDGQGRWDAGPLQAGDWPVELSDPTKRHEFVGLGSDVQLDQPGRVTVRVRERSEVVTTMPYAAPETVRGATLGWREDAVVPVTTALRASPGTWLPTETTTAVQWLRDERPIPGATGAAYTIQLHDAGARIRARVVATANGRSSTVHTYPVVVAAGGTRSADPTIDDLTPEWDQVLHATPQGYWPDPRGWQWYRDGAPIPGATASSHHVTTEDSGHRLAVALTWPDPDGRPVAAGFSASTSPVVGVRPDVTVGVKALGKRRVRLTVRARSAHVRASLLDARVVISRVRKGSDRIAVRTMRNGDLRVTVKKQPRGRQTYYATVQPSAHRTVAVESPRRRVRVR